MVDTPSGRICSLMEASIQRGRENILAMQQSLAGLRGILGKLNAQAPSDAALIAETGAVIDELRRRIEAASVQVDVLEEELTRRRGRAREAFHRPDD